MPKQERLQKKLIPQLKLLLRLMEKKLNGKIEVALTRMQQCEGNFLSLSKPIYFLIRLTHSVGALHCCS